MATRIKSEDFLAAFLQANANLVADPLHYSNSSLWTRHMCGHGDSSGVIPKTAERLSDLIPGLRHQTQWYTLDAVLVAYQADSDADRLGYPPFVHCIIEHENGDNWHEEVWKLAHWRAPLKVLIVYDFNDDRKSNQKQRDWVDHRIKELLVFLRTMEDLHGEDPSEFLLVVGSKRTSHDTLVNWRCCLLNHHEDSLRPIADILARQSE